MALGDCEATDNTRQSVLSIGSDKIKIIDTVWDVKSFPRNMELAHQTDLAMSHCSGDWLFYLQSDEVVHEDDLEPLRLLMAKYEKNPDVEGILFNYIHFWGDYSYNFV